MLTKNTFFLLLFPLFLFAQQPPATPGELRLKEMESRKQLSENSLIDQIPFRSVGPSVFGGRIVDLEVDPNDPTTFYAAYASGGLWKTVDNGISFTPIFDNEAVMTIGDIAVDWERGTIWIGTGENNSSRSSYSGTGMYRSDDDGKTWQYRGLPESHHIGRIILHPTDPNTLWVAVLGHLYSPNEERGVYKSTDAGATWNRTLYVDDNSGTVDLVIDVNDPNTLYAATWHRERRAWDFVESGTGSGIHKSTDGGNTWSLLSTTASGFPIGNGVGRIGLTTAKKDNKTVLYAIVDNQARRPKDKKDEKKDMLTKDDLRTMSKADFLKLEEKKVKAFLRSNRFPRKYSAKKVIGMVQEDKILPAALTEYLEDANSLLFDTPVIGAEVYRSDDEGKTWKKTHKGHIDDLFYSYGYYFGQIRVNPTDVSKIYIVGVPVLRSEDGGATFKSINGDNVHVDHHALWVDPGKSGHLILGNDGGVNISYDDGDHWVKCNTPAVGQFYTVAVDMAKPYNIYGGLQDNGVWMGRNTYRAGVRWHNSGRYPYKSIMGGDGMQVAIDTRDNNTVYTGFQFGNYYRINKTTEESKGITPKHELGERPLRWNWQTPIHLSIHNQDILYMGSNKLHRSFNQGDDFKVISKDLTKGGRKGDVAYGTLTSIHESPLRFGLLYTGSDDGLVHVTKDNGNTWKKLNNGLPEDMWVTKVQASSHEENRVYLSLNGYRWDDFTAYLYRSDDYGDTWERIGTDLPSEPINVVKEDPHQPHIIYVGTDHGLYVSFNQGETFMLMNGELPAVSVHDLVVHPREHDLVIGTHGRSFYVADVTEMQKLNDEVFAKAVHIFPYDDIYWSSRWGNSFSQWRDPFVPEFKFPVFIKSDGSVTITVKTKEGQILKSLTHSGKKGINYIEYDLSIMDSSVKKYTKVLNEDRKKDEDEIKIEKADNGSVYLYKGKYDVEITKDGVTEKGELVIKERK